MSENDEKLQRTQIRFTKEQLDWLKKQGNVSETVREAVNKLREAKQAEQSKDDPVTLNKRLNNLNGQIAEIEKSDEYKQALEFRDKHDQLVKVKEEIIGEKGYLLHSLFTPHSVYRPNGFGLCADISFLISNTDLQSLLQCNF